MDLQPRLQTPLLPAKPKPDPCIAVREKRARMHRWPRTVGQRKGSLERPRTAALPRDDRRKRRLAAFGQTNHDTAIHYIPSATRYKRIHLHHVRVEWAAAEPLLPLQ